MKIAHLAALSHGVALASAALLGCSSTGGPDPNALPAPRGIQPNVAPPADPGAGALLLTTSGETLAVTGFPFPPADVNATFMVDGWQFSLDRYLTVFEDVTLWDDPDLVPTDQSQH